MILQMDTRILKLRFSPKMDDWKTTVSEIGSLFLVSGAFAVSFKESNSLGSGPLRRMPVGFASSQESHKIFYLNVTQNMKFKKN